jgi:uncharacterized protein YgbK (DUF1537 family)
VNTVAAVPLAPLPAPRVGVVADDTTGALDIGSVFLRTGRTVRVWLHPLREPLRSDVDVTILDTDSRLDPPGLAHTKTTAATRELRAAGCTHFYKKTCSVFRGNVGAEFEAMLDALGVPTALISLAYPALGRATVGGHHFVQGVPLSETAFRRDPVHPCTTSDLGAVLAQQSRRPATVVPLATVRAGVDALRAALAEAAPAHAFVIVDGETPADLAVLAAAAAGFPLLGGAAGLAAAWPVSHAATRPTPATGRPPQASSATGALIVCGSLTPQSLAQVQFLHTAGVHSRMLPTAIARGASDRTAWIDATVETAAAVLASGRDFLVHSEPQGPAGDNARILARCVAQSLAAVAHGVFQCLQPGALIVAGGDTSGAVSRALGLAAVDLVAELAPGVPLGRASGAVTLPVVLKSGSFGADDFLALAAQRARAAAPLIPTPVTPCSAD